MLCEKCKKEHDGSYASGRFCSPKCARSFSTLNKRQKINQKVFKRLKGNRCIKGGLLKLCDYGCGQEAKYQLKNGKWCCNKNSSLCPNIKRKISKELNYKNKNNIPVSNWISFKRNLPDNFGEICRKGQNKFHKKKDVYIMDSTPFEEWPVRLIKKQLVIENKNKCQICGYEYTDPVSGKGPFQFHHIDGNHNNWSRDNIQFLCLNCHWKTPNFAFRGRSHSEKTKKLISKKVKEYAKTK